MLHVVKLIERRHPGHARRIVTLLLTASLALLCGGLITLLLR